MVVEFAAVGAWVVVRVEGFEGGEVGQVDIGFIVDGDVGRADELVGKAFFVEIG